MVKEMCEDHEDEDNYGDDLDRIFSNAGLPPLECDCYLPDEISLNRARRMLITGVWEPHPHWLEHTRNLHHCNDDDSDADLDWCDPEDEESNLF